MKRIVKILLCATIMLLCVFKQKDVKAEIFNGWSYSGSMLTGATVDSNKTGTITIPAELNGTKITSIGAYAFANCTGITNVIIPDTIEHIGDHAFDGCTKLVYVYFKHRDMRASAATMLGTSVFDSHIVYIKGVPESGASQLIAYMSNGRYSDMSYSIVGNILTSPTAGTEVTPELFTLYYYFSDIDYTLEIKDGNTHISLTKNYIVSLGNNTYVLKYAGYVPTVTVSYYCKDAGGVVNKDAKLLRLSAEYNGTIIVGTDLVSSKMLVVGYYDDDTTAVISRYTHDFTKTYTPGRVKVNISYDGVATTVDVEVIAKTMVNIRITKLPDKLNYGWRENLELDLTGMTAVITYNDGSTTELKEGALRTQITTSTKIANEPYYGTYTVFVYPQYGNTSLSDYFTINVRATVVTQITATSPTYNTKVNAKLNTAGIHVTGIYDNGDTFEVSTYTTNWTPKQKSGVYDCIIYWDTLNTTVKVTVEDLSLTRIDAICNVPSVLPGTEITTNDFTVIGYYDDGSSEQLEDFTLSTNKITQLGKTIVTIHYGKLSTTAKVKCAELEEDSIEIVTLPKQTEFSESDRFNYEGLTVKLNYTDKSSTTISSGFRVTGFNNMSYGEQTIYVTYHTLRCSYTIVRKENLVKELKLITSDNTTFYVGETITLKNVYGYLIYEDGTVKPMEFDAFRCSTASSSRTGNIPVRVSYDQKLADGTTHTVSTEITVSVIKKTISSIYIAKMPTKLEYNIGDKLNTSGIVVKARYTEGGTCTITDSCTFSGFKSDTKGNGTVTVKYDTYSTTFDVTIKEPSPVSLKLIVPIGVVLSEEQRPTNIGAQLLVYYDDGSFAETEDYTCVALYNDLGDKILRIVSNGLVTDYVLATAAELQAARLNNGNFDESSDKPTNPITGNTIDVIIPLLIEVCVTPTKDDVEVFYTITNKSEINLSLYLDDVYNEEYPVGSTSMTMIAGKSCVSCYGSANSIELGTIPANNSMNDLFTFTYKKAFDVPICTSYYLSYTLHNK